MNHTASGGDGGVAGEQPVNSCSAGSRLLGVPHHCCASRDTVSVTLLCAKRCFGGDVTELLEIQS